MSRQNSSPLASYVERARKILQHEQRLHYQDKAIISGGLELFASRWADETSTVCQQAGLDLAPIHHFVEHLEGYRKQDPMQRAASLRAALSILNELDNHGPDSVQASSVATSAQPDASPASRTPPRTVQVSEKSVPPQKDHKPAVQKATKAQVNGARESVPTKPSSPRSTAP